MDNKVNKPYYAVIFSSKRTEGDKGYAHMAAKMEELAKQQAGFLGIESAQGNANITVSYWESLETIKNWKENSAHCYAQEKGKQDWYSWFKVRICKIEHEYEFER